MAHMDVSEARRPVPVRKPAKPEKPEAVDRKMVAGVVISLVLAAAFLVWIIRYDRTHNGSAASGAGNGGPNILWGGRQGSTLSRF